MILKMDLDILGWLELKVKKVDRSSLNIKKCLFEGKNDRYFGLIRAESEKS